MQSAFALHRHLIPCLISYHKKELPMLARFSARLTELRQSPVTALERGKTALQQAENHQKNREFEQMQSSLHTAKAAHIFVR